MTVNRSEHHEPASRVAAKARAVVAVDRVVYRCTGCQAVFLDKAVAERCCHCEECGQPHLGGWCRPCAKKRADESDMAAFEKATKVPLAEYKHDYVMCDGLGGGLAKGADEGGYLHVDSLDDAWAPEHRPKFVWGCAPQDKPSYNLAEELTERLSDEYHENVLEAVVSGGPEIEEAQKLLDKALARGIDGFVEDRSIAVLLPEPKP
jgi:hypothetical protein